MFAALSLIEMIVFGVFFLALIIGTSYDRRGVEDGKWWVVLVSFILVAVYYWSDFTFSGLWDVVRTWGFWEPLMYFFGIGLVYSGLEFSLYVRRTAKRYEVEWKKHLTQVESVKVIGEDGNVKTEVRKNRDGGTYLHEFTRRRPYSEVYDDVREKGASSALFNTAREYSEKFIRQYFFKNQIIELDLDPVTKIDVVPVVNKRELAEHIAAWTSLWPAYAVSLVVGDLLAEVWSTLSSLLAKISGQFVKLSFANVFKF